MTDLPALVAEIERQVLAPGIRLGFFLGAGTSMAAGLPGISALTREVEEGLEGESRTMVDSVRSLLREQATIEEVLSAVRLLKAVLASSPAALGPFSHEALTQADSSICRAIRQAVEYNHTPDLSTYLRFVGFLRALHTRQPIELFTSNYDRLVERAMEAERVPYFDGFVGAEAAFFRDDLISGHASAFPADWLRYWKVHGSIAWYDSADGPVRTWRTDISDDVEYLVFPSVDKYQQSRRPPFIALQDRFRSFCQQQDVLLLMTGYSWGDDHINEIVIRGLETNPRMHVVALFHGEAPAIATDSARRLGGLTVLGRASGIHRGAPIGWSHTDGATWWNSVDGSFRLGDFVALVEHLCLLSPPALLSQAAEPSSAPPPAPPI